MPAILTEGVNEPLYLPSPEEILAACREIQDNWTDSERMRRAGTPRSHRSIRVCRVNSVSRAAGDKALEAAWVS